MIKYCSVFAFRLEYEQNRDMDTRIEELQSSISNLLKDLERVQKKEAEANSAAEKASDEIDQLKEEAQGMIIVWHGTVLFLAKLNSKILGIVASIFRFNFMIVVLFLSFSQVIQTSWKPTLFFY